MNEAAAKTIHLDSGKKYEHELCLTSKLLEDEFFHRSVGLLCVCRAVRVLIAENEKLRAELEFIGP